MKQFYKKNELEAGIDEVARGCLAGRVYTAAVVWPKEFSDPENHPVLKDSKKLSPRRRLILKDYIEENAIDFAIGWEDEKTIDKINILNATYSAMHKALDNLHLELDSIIVDGDKFKQFKDVYYTCIVGGDNLYAPILKFILKQQNKGKKRLIMFYYLAPQDWEKQH